MQVVLSTVRARFSKVQHISTGTLDKWLEEGVSLKLLDCRDLEEYAVSHLPGAEVVPWTDVQPTVDWISQEQQNDSVKLKVICYCSVGYRSSSFADSLQTHIKKEGGSIPEIEIYNLEGSIFKWGNEGRHLVDKDGKDTVFVHPYNAVWGKLLNSNIRYGVQNELHSLT